jgi:hypothetical protein
MIGRTYLAYSAADDGIHIRCRECPGWDARLGFVPGTADAYVTALNHIQAAHGGKPRPEGPDEP